MADNSETKPEDASQNPDQLVKLCKRRLENWREVLIHLHSLLVWEKPFYPGITAGTVTVVFLLLWYFDPSVLTTFSVFGIVACLLDYAVPMLSSTFFDSSKWTGSREKKYEDICRSLVGCYVKTKHICDYLRQTKETKPYLYVLGVVGTLILTAWIGNLISNLFLTYLIVLLSALSPGLKSQQLIQDAVASVLAMIGQGKKKK
ncbi:ADP-ribosylation factor-like protein 6-interacting protein 1 [Parasteatoda tepidariorum]|uniref:ADP-ribosylation factor-like protein 6-interacting protein 1 n=1 Tax=Parasteatoda tepidariorum TaxID=114398 RepID=UPI00077F8CC5|nr:ADP-ribosylation factor-like protein 6-interacting protein 1 [Parasteatoda tepidariorum]